MTAAARQKEESPARLSFITAGLSGVLVLALVGYLTWHALQPGPPAAITADIVPAEAWKRNELLYVPVDVRNVGSRPASEVVIEMRLEGEGGGGTTIGFLAGGESQRIYAAFPEGIDIGPLIARVVSFQEP
ncbi:hypothetical protein BH18GEM1_BH18GEM1_17700 [soil metagenome]